jgi:hydroxyethylthiazole kinase-like uncharacterized protein yjeF
MTRPATTVLPVAEVRRLEAAAMAELPEGALMQRAAMAIAVEAGAMLRELRGATSGARVVLLVGAGDNGGDALYAGARLATRGARVDALLVADGHHEEGAAALRRSGGRLHGPVAADDLAAAELLAAADLVLDGILGIGGRGALRDPAAWVADLVHELDLAVLAVDLPSGVDADTGAVADAAAAVHADRTIVLGALKAGVLLGDGAELAGELAVVGIGLDLDDAEDAVVRVDDEAAAAVLDRPEPYDDKYSRGAVGICAGSATYPGAAVLATAGARHGLAGYVRYAGGAQSSVVAAWPDVVAVEGGVAAAGRVQAWAVGPGRGTDDDAARDVLDALALDVPVLLDADAITLVAERAEVREALVRRTEVTVLTPHAGEFARLTGREVGPDRIAEVRALAEELGSVVLLKGAATVVASPDGATFVAVAGPPELATAGSGDVLTGFLASLLATHGAVADLDPDLAAALAAAAAHVHGVAAALAVGSGRTVTAVDVAAALPAAVARLRARSATD